MEPTSPSWYAATIILKTTLIRRTRAHRSRPKQRVSTVTDIQEQTLSTPCRHRPHGGVTAGGATPQENLPPISALPAVPPSAPPPRPHSKPRTPPSHRFRLPPIFSLTRKPRRVSSGLPASTLSVFIPIAFSHTQFPAPLSRLLLSLSSRSFSTKNQLACLLALGPPSPFTPSIVVLVLGHISLTSSLSSPTRRVVWIKPVFRRWLSNGLYET